MSRQPVLNIKDLHEYMYNNCDRNGILQLTTKQIAEHFDVTVANVHTYINRLDKAGLLIKYRRKGSKSYVAQIMAWDINNINRVNDKNSLEVLREVDRTLKKCIDYFYTEKNKLLDIDDVGVVYTGLDEISEKCLYGDLVALQEFLEDFNEFIRYREVHKNE